MVFQSVLIIGASGRLGTDMINRLAETKHNRPKIYAFCRTPNTFDTDNRSFCDGVVQGDARESKDLKDALIETKADLVIMAIGNGDNIGKTDIRTASAKALVKVLDSDGFGHIKVIVVSSTGSGGTQIKAGFGVGRIIEFVLRNVLKDHDGQELAFKTTIEDRTLIVRPTELVDKYPKQDSVVIFDASKKYPSLKIHRKDVSAWIIDKGMEGKYFGQAVNITCA